MLTSPLSVDVSPPPQPLIAVIAAMKAIIHPFLSRVTRLIYKLRILSGFQGIYAPIITLFAGNRCLGAVGLERCRSTIGRRDIGYICWHPFVTVMDAHFQRGLFASTE